MAILAKNGQILTIFWPFWRSKNFSTKKILAILGHFAAKNGRHFEIRPNFEKKLLQFFAPMVCIWSKFQLPQHIPTKSRSNKCEMPVFAFLSCGAHFWQKLAYFSSILLKIRKISYILWFCMVQTMEIHEKNIKNRSKTIFGSRKSQFQPIFAHIFLYKLYREVRNFCHTQPYSNANILSQELNFCIL